MTSTPKRSIAGIDPQLCTERQGRSLFVQLQSEMMKPENEELRVLATEMAKRSALQRSGFERNQLVVSRLCDPSAFASCPSAFASQEEDEEAELEATRGAPIWRH